MGARVENIEMMRHVVLSLIYSSISIMHYPDPKNALVIVTGASRFSSRYIYIVTNHDFLPAKNTNIPPLITTTNQQGQETGLCWV